MTTSHRQILRTSAVTGTAAILTNVIGLIRLKAVALILGPVGVGLIGLFTNLVTVAASIAGLGLNASGVREVANAEANGDRKLLSATIVALAACTILLAALATAAVWLLRDPVAHWLQLGPGGSREVGWLSLAAGLSVLMALPLTLLNGFRHIRALATVQVVAALLGTIAGLAILAAWGSKGLIAYVIAGPASGVIAGFASWQKMKPEQRPKSDRELVTGQAKHMIRLGFAFMLSGLALSLAVLLVRTRIKSAIGDVPLGLFAAAWTISSIYVSLVLQAMTADFYPRLSAIIADREEASRLVSEQVETAMLLATPILLLTLGFAPLVLQLAYSSAFTDAADLLRWQIVGDVFKIMAWPLAIALLAARRSWAYWSIETITAFLLAAFVWLTIERFGLEAAGLGYVAMYAFYFLAQLVMARGNSWLGRRAVLTCGASTATVAIVLLVIMRSEMAGMILAGLTSLVFAVVAFARMHSTGALRNWREG
jgi:PST family polysaccharide transporter